MRRRELLGGLVVAATGCRVPEPPASAGAGAFALEEATLASLQRGLGESRFTSEQLVEVYSARIRDVDRTLRSILEANPDAIPIARRLDVERRAGRVRGPLHGIPIV